VSCGKCGRAKSKIKQEILKLSEQLKSSNRSEEEINAKIKEFINYLETMKRNESSEITETEESQAMPNSVSHDEIEQNILEENEGINVFASTSNAEENSASQSQPEEGRRFISLNDIHSNDELDSMSVKQLKEVLMINRVDFRGCCEKNELKERVKRLWESHKSAPRE
jgi:seryl-tRNA synthetase